MEIQFEELIQSLIEDNIGVSEHFINKTLSKQLKKNLLHLYDDHQFQEAKVGNQEKLSEEKLIRTDSIYWLDKKHDNRDEDAFLNLIGGFVNHLNMTCYAGITDCEFHYSLYEKGSFYKKHIDQFQDNSSRKYSMISYLNDAWIEGSGGELLIHQGSNNLSISPTNGKTVFFRSNELEHEVLVTNERRLSITGWLKG